MSDVRSAKELNNGRKTGEAACLKSKTIDASNAGGIANAKDNRWMERREDRLSRYLKKRTSGRLVRFEQILW